MKQLIIILLCLWGTAQAQTKGYFRYDSIQFEKVGGNAEFILLNASRGVTGGVLTNTWNGRTAFVLPSAAGWGLTGNAGTVAGTNFLGTTDAVNLQLRTGGSKRFTINTSGAFGLGTGEDYGTNGYIMRTNGSGGAPTWVNPTSIVTATPTWQQTLTASSVLSGSNTIDMDGNEFIWTTNAGFRVANGVSSFGLGITGGDSNLNALSAHIQRGLRLSGIPTTGTIYKTLRITSNGTVIATDTSAAGASGLTVGTTTIASGTVGGIVFQGAGNVVQQDATNFFWDDTNNRLGIGTNAPGAKLEISATDASIRAVTTSSTGFARFRAEGDASSYLFEGFQYGSAVAGTDAIGVNNAGLALLYTGGASTNLVFRTGNAGANIIFGAGAGTAEHFRINFGWTLTASSLAGTGTRSVTASSTGVLAAGPIITSGTYTPTLTNVTNITASTAYDCQYLRVGNTVTVSGKVDIDVTLGAASELGLSLPIASNMTAEENLGGTASSPAAASLVSAIRADFTNDRAAFVFTAISLTNDSYFFEFTYQIK